MQPLERRGDHRPDVRANYSVRPQFSFSDVKCPRSSMAIFDLGRSYFNCCLFKIIIGQGEYIDNHISSWRDGYDGTVPGEAVAGQ